MLLVGAASDVMCNTADKLKELRQPSKVWPKDSDSDRMSTTELKRFNVLSLVKRSIGGCLFNVVLAGLERVSDPE